jgi:catechol 2,3-dioxygenase-like lactoylglutathione lyase family enzyme
MAKLLSAYGYQGDTMNLPVADVEAAIPFYVEKLGFTVVDQNAGPINKAVLERDGVQFAIAENGGDPEHDGCAFHTDDVHALCEEFTQTDSRASATSTRNFAVDEQQNIHLQFSVSCTGGNDFGGD